MARRKLTDEELRRAVEEGLSDKEIAEKYGMSYTWIVYRRKRLGLLSNPPKTELFYMIDAKPEILAYLAGIADGEGTFYIKKRKVAGCKNPLYEERFSIKITSKEIVELFKKVFKRGSVTIEGKLYQSEAQIQAGIKRNRKLYLYEAGDKVAATIAYYLHPYLIIKKRQSELLVELRRNKILGRGRYRKQLGGLPKEDLEFRERLYLEIKQLNNGGGER